LKLDARKARGRQCRPPKWQKWGIREGQKRQQKGVHRSSASHQVFLDGPPLRKIHFPTSIGLMVGEGGTRNINIHLITISADGKERPQGLRFCRPQPPPAMRLGRTVMRIGLLAKLPRPHNTIDSPH